MESPGVAECNSVSFIKCIGHSFWFRIANICVSDSEPISDHPG